MTNTTIAFDSLAPNRQYPYPATLPSVSSSDSDDALSRAAHRHETLIEREREVLGASLRRNDLALQLPLAPQHFRVKDHALIWTAILALVESGETADIFTVSEKIGIGITYLSELYIHCISDTPSRIEGFAAVLIEQYEKAKRARELQQLALDANDLSSNEIDARLVDLTLSGTAPKKQRDSMNDILKLCIENIDALASGQKSPIGLSWGVGEFDALTRGLLPSELVILAGRPGMGKSALASQVSMLAAISGKRTVFFSLEMANQDNADRQLANAARVNNEVITDPANHTGELHRLASGVNKLKDIEQTLIDDVFDIEAIISEVHRMHAQKPLDLVVIDYIQLIGSNDPIFQKMNPTHQVGTISRRLKQLAMQLNVPVLALSQLNRSVEQRPNKRPLMSDLRESGNLEQDANKIIFVYRHEKYEPEDPQYHNICELILPKHRNGPTGTTVAHCDMSMYLFADLTHNTRAQSQANVMAGAF
nr:DnaB-like helicase C-terminal domain-containing protein [uncultured Halomonas sp.]